MLHVQGPKEGLSYAVDKGLSRRLEESNARAGYRGRTGEDD